MQNLRKVALALVLSKVLGEPSQEPEAAGPIEPLPAGAATPLPLSIVSESEPARDAPFHEFVAEPRKPQVSRPPSLRSALLRKPGETRTPPATETDPVLPRRFPGGERVVSSQPEHRLARRDRQAPPTPARVGENDPHAPSPVASPPRLHRVNDGDTLAGLARRYYGDPTLGHLIYEANRGLLSDPRLLPIGVELVIPPGRRD